MMSALTLKRLTIRARGQHLIFLSIQFFKFGQMIIKCKKQPSQQTKLTSNALVYVRMTAHVMRNVTGVSQDLSIYLLATAIILMESTRRLTTIILKNLKT